MRNWQIVFVNLYTLGLVLKTTIKNKNNKIKNTIFAHNMY